MKSYMYFKFLLQMMRISSMNNAVNESLTNTQIDDDPEKSIISLRLNSTKKQQDKEKKTQLQTPENTRVFNVLFREHNHNILYKFFIFCNIALTFCYFINSLLHKSLRIDDSIIFLIITSCNSLISWLTKITKQQNNAKRLMCLLANFAIVSSALTGSVLGYFTKHITDCQRFTGSLDCSSVIIFIEIILEALMLFVIICKVLIT